MFLASIFGAPLPIWTSCLAISKKVFNIVGGFPVGESVSEDLDTWLRVSLSFPIAWSNEILAIYYQNAANRAYGVKRYDHEPKICQTIRQTLQSDLVPHGIKQDLQEYAARMQLYAARDCLTLGKRDTALQLLDYARGTRLFAREWQRLRLWAMLPGKSVHYIWKLKRLGYRKKPRPLVNW
jgi:hypothetical protein